MAYNSFDHRTRGRQEDFDSFYSEVGAPDKFESLENLHRLYLSLLREQYPWYLDDYNELYLGPIAVLGES